MTNSRINFGRVGICIAIAAAICFGIYSIRAWGPIHGPIMFFYQNPWIWVMPIAVTLGTFLVCSVFRAIGYWRDQNGRQASNVLESVLGADNWSYVVAAVVGVVALVVGMATNTMMNNYSTYKHYKFDLIENLPAAGQARIVPREVAESMTAAGYDQSAYHLGDAHISMGADDELLWTFGEIPSNVFNKFGRNTNGVYTQNASTTERDIDINDVEFKISPGRYFANSPSWNVYNEHFWTSVAETVFIVTPDGETLLLAPYVKYEGFWTKVPVFAGVMVFHPDGTKEDLTPEEAAADERIANSGRIYPESLARKIQESYKYKNGIWNRLITHQDMTVVEKDGSSDNAQPYLMDFKDEGTMWVSTANPYSSKATNAIFLTDSITGENQIWQPGKEASLTGSRQALSVAEGLAIPGITYGGGKYTAIEPRPLIHNGRLMFLVSVVPKTYTQVTKTIVIDASTNKAVAVFDHDVDPEADQALIDYMNGADIEDLSAEVSTDTDSGTETDTGDTGNDSSENPDETISVEEYENQKELIEKLIQNSREQQALLDELVRQQKEQQKNK